jgi:hypothetical protein
MLEGGTVVWDGFSSRDHLKDRKTMKMGDLFSMVSMVFVVFVVFVGESLRP